MAGLEVSTLVPDRTLPNIGMVRVDATRLPTSRLRVCIIKLSSAAKGPDEHGNE